MWKGAPLCPCLWHGCLLCFPRRDQHSKLSRDRTFQEMYEATVCKHTMLEHAGSISYTSGNVSGTNKSIAIQTFVFCFFSFSSNTSGTPGYFFRWPDQRCCTLLQDRYLDWRGDKVRGRHVALPLYQHER